MKKSKFLAVIIIPTIILSFFIASGFAQNVGIGTTIPFHRLHVLTSIPATNAIHGENWGTTNGTSWGPGTNFSGVHGEAAFGTTQFQSGIYGYQSGTGFNSGGVVGAYSTSTWGSLGYTDGSGALWGMYTPSNVFVGSKEGIGTGTPDYSLDVRGGIGIQNNTGSNSNDLIIKRPGISSPGNVNFIFSERDTNNDLWLYGYDGATYKYFVSFNYSTNKISFPSGGSALVVDNSNSKVGIGIISPTYPLDVRGSTYTVGNFVNTFLGSDYEGIEASCNNTPGFGEGIVGYGGYIGVKGIANLPGSGNRFGVIGAASGGSLNYAGYFSGDVYTTGTYISSDRKLKKDIKPLINALFVIEQLRPSAYTYKTTEYKEMNLPEGLQYGLIADDVMKVLPGMVKKAVQPSENSNHSLPVGLRKNKEISFNAVNYTQMIPLLISAIQEQQAIIMSKEKKIDELENRIVRIERKYPDNPAK